MSSQSISIKIPKFPKVKKRPHFDAYTFIGLWVPFDDASWTVTRRQGHFKTSHLRENVRDYNLAAILQADLKLK